MPIPFEPGDANDYNWMPDGYSNHVEDDEQGQATDLDDVTNGEEDPIEEPKPRTQSINLAGGGRSVTIQLDDIDAERACQLGLAMWSAMGPQPRDPIGFGAEALHTERSDQVE